MRSSEKPSLVIGNLPFYDTPGYVEGSPYWVDLWANVNGYRIGLQVKPKTYRSASLSVYSGKAQASQLSGHAMFQKQFGGKVMIVTPNRGELGASEQGEVLREVRRLEGLPPGPYGPLP